MDLDEHEQGERVRSWLRNNGSSLITGIAFGLALVFAWQWWQGRGVRHQEEAATQFQSFNEAVEAKDLAKAKVFSDQLASKYGDTPYAQLAALRTAATLQASGKVDEAVRLLSAGLAGVKGADLAELYRLRIGRLLLISGKPAEARKQLDAVAKPLFPAVADELRGDIATAEGRRDDARKSYEKALTTLDQAAPTRGMLELKLIDAGGQPPAKPET